MVVSAKRTSQSVVCQLSPPQAKKEWGPGGHIYGHHGHPCAPHPPPLQTECVLV